MNIEQFAFDQDGMKKVYVNDNWMVGLKNWKPENDINGFNNLERHNETDELFVLLSGECHLVYAEEEDGRLAFSSVQMEQNKVYNIPKTLWHNTITQKDTKLALIEAPDTSMENSDVMELDREQVKEIKDLIG
ncbi:cupin [Gracilibacillus sp. YIM 98692]|uniref:cupin n=1 Tax=Gracilibacillus sp. YIM 98692 TaxID=2663532 RepID=UPI0013D17AD1|nr:cupin [Gracilibacillus sp. YIM 98692]